MLPRHLAQAQAAMPGPDYLAVLPWIHEILRPATYVEIGVSCGSSLLLARPETIAVGIDPKPEVTAELPARTQVVPLASDDFFARHDLSRVLNAPHVDLAFIDGLHLFEQALRDFAHLERWAGPGSVIMIHDCLPLDRLTAERVRTTHFYSGDVWKLVVCLREHRPDLALGIVRTPPTGLCLVTRLDPRSRVLAGLTDAQIAEYIARPFDEALVDRPAFPELIDDRYDAVRE